MKIIVGDIETLKGMSLFSFYDPEKESWHEFEVSPRRNDLYAFAKFMLDHVAPNYHVVMFNGINFDSQVMEFVLRNYHKWHEMENMEIVEMIYKKSQHAISDSNYDVLPLFREDEVSFKQIDVYKIPHFDNKARRCSLKWLEFMMNMPDIMEMPYDHRKLEFTSEELEEIKGYCRNDIISTYEWYKYIIGETDHPSYKGQNKIQDRLDFIQEFGLPARAINFSDVKLGDEFNKMAYCKATNKSINELYQLRRARKATPKFTYGDCIPKYVNFQASEFQGLYDRVKNIRVSLNNKNPQEFLLRYNGTEYCIARGGIHTNEGNRVIIPAEDEVLMDADISSQYPCALVKRGLFPSHLGKEWLVNYKETIQRRISYKARKDDPKYKSLSESLKLALNGGAFGKTGERENWQYDPKVTFYCTIGNQFEILMLIEMMEDAGIHVVSANTDGITCLFKKELLREYYTIAAEWEVMVGNTEMGQLEFTEYSKLWQESVNHYIAVKKDGELKVKGRFRIEDELHKNNTDKIERITRKAIQQWVKDGTSVRETIRSSKNIYEFCVGKKSSKDYRWETIDHLGERTRYQRLIRFYISNSGYTLIKVKNEESEAPGNPITHFFQGQKVTICNRIEEANINDIDYEYYEKNAKEIIEKVEGRAKKGLQVAENQLSLF